MTCTSDCPRVTPGQAHCTVCHRTFGGVSGFDRHRHKRRGNPEVGSMATCIDPGAFGYVERDGVWREPMDHNKVAMFRNRVAGTRGRKT